MYANVPATFPALQKESAHCGILLPAAHVHQAKVSGHLEQLMGFRNSSQQIIIVNFLKVENIKRK